MVATVRSPDFVTHLERSSTLPFENIRSLPGDLQRGFARALANFAYNFDFPTNMAIVYYGVHGQFVEGRHKLFAKEKENNDGDPATFFFDDAIHQLKLPDTDILILVSWFQP